MDSGELCVMIFFGSTDAKIVCRQLGYTGAAEYDSLSL